MWVRIDDHFDEHPKMAEVGPLGWGVWLAGLAYCNRNLTDGFIPYSVAESIGGKWRIRVPDADGRTVVWTVARTSGMSGENIETEWVIDLLIKAGLWEPTDGGYMVHDFDDYQPLKADMTTDRQKLSEVRRAAGAIGGRAKAAKAQASGKSLAKPEDEASKTGMESGGCVASSKQTPSKTLANAWQKPSPVPDPDPVATEQPPKAPRGKTDDPPLAPHRPPEPQGEGEITLRDLEQLAIECIPVTSRRGKPTSLDGVSAATLAKLVAVHGAGAVRDTLQDCGGMDLPVQAAKARLSKARASPPAVAPPPPPVAVVSPVPLDPEAERARAKAALKILAAGGL